jgi:hypothetical protein
MQGRDTRIMALQRVFAGIDFSVGIDVSNGP